MASVFAIAERLVVGEATATQRNGVPAGEAELFARGITNRHIAFDTQGAIIVNRDLCHRSNVALGHAHPARQLKPQIAPHLSLDSLLAPGRWPSQWLPDNIAATHPVALMKTAGWALIAF